ncbi:hypothetical protein C8J33_11940 [Rhizobium sp. PP-CC-3G-465]|nr:hypothetical protein C8J33_11940 [Rhizobium sp. PP-CC-3G-465]
MRTLAPLPCFFGVGFRVVHRKDVPMSSKLVSEEISNSTFKGSCICSGTGRHDDMHHITAFAAVKLFAPLLLNEISGRFTVCY